MKLAVHRESGREVAVKVMRLPASDAEPQEALATDGSPNASGSLPGRVSLEEDVLKEIDVLKSLDQLRAARSCVLHAVSDAPLPRSPNCLKMHEYYLGALYARPAFGRCGGAALTRARVQISRTRRRSWSPTTARAASC